MFVISTTRKNLKKTLIVAVIVCVVVAIVFFMVKSDGKSEQSDNNVEVSQSLKGETSSDILKFISSFGWEVDSDPTEVRDVAIPQEFDDVYTNYNNIQKEQGFDLRSYAGKLCKRWTYTVRNYPGCSPDDDYIRINVLVCDGVIIGGDVCSVKLDGFMHGFKKE